jgi:uncharacterized damage-inducible protein DinB
MILELKQEHATTMSLLEACPEDKLGWKPDDKCMPFGEHFHHIYTGGLWLTTVALPPEEKGKVLGDEQPSVPDTKDGIKADCEKLYGAAVKLWEGLSPEGLATPREFEGMGAFPAIMYLRWNISHLIHHRAQVQLYLRLMGAKCPSIYGPTADVSFEEVIASAKA